MTIHEPKSPSTGDEARLREGIAIANIPTLLMVLVQLTGDLKWLDTPYRPGRGQGLSDNDDGGLPEAVQTEIRTAATDAILAWRSGKPVALDDPDETLLVHMLSVAMGETVPDNYGPIIAAGLGTKSAPKPNQPDTSKMPEGFKVLVVGAGVSGIAASIRLKEAGIPYEVFEKGDTVGGTWRANRYPGAGVDTPNHLYSFSFAKYDWSHYFALQGELHAYFRDVAERFGILDRIRFRTHVTSAVYDETRAIWVVTTRDGESRETTHEANVVISGVGVLDIPKWPDIPGIRDFAGHAFHSAEWPDGLELAGKRVAIIGNGATSMQIVPEIAPKVSELIVFQRSKQWAAPFEQFRKPVPDAIRFLIRDVPLYQAWYRQRLAWTFNDRIHSSLQKDPDWAHKDRSLNATNESHRRFFTRYIEKELAHRPELIEKMTPDYPPFGKRMLLDNGWYRAIARDNVTLVDTGVSRIEGNRIVAGDESAHEADILIVATGFKASNFLASMNITGRGGVKLSEHWEEDDARAYLGTTIPGFPNLFTLLGPNVGLGHGGSIIASVESQVNYVMGLIAEMFDSGIAAVEVREDAHDRHNELVDAAHEAMVWTHPGMRNWYRNSRGRVVAITPFRNDETWHRMRRPKLDDYILDKRA